MLNRYLVFRGDNYYPGGGWDDFIESHATIAEARVVAAACRADWTHITDTQTGKVVPDDAVDAPPAPKPALDATAVARAFEVMLPAHEDDGVFLCHNPHRAMLTQPIINGPVRTMTATEWLRGERDIEFVGPTEQQKVEETNSLWLLEWVPPGMTKQTRLAAATLPALAEWLQDNGLAFGN